MAQVKDVLERLYTRYNHRRCIKRDPLQFVYRYSDPADMEVAGFLASVLAYGRVEQIEKSLEKLFGLMGDSPFEFVSSFDKSERKRLKGFKHRFTDGDALSDLMVLLKKVLREYGSIEGFFVRGSSPADENIIPALSKFCDSLLEMHSKNHNGHLPEGLRYLLPRPALCSACKRLNMFLRWMVRDDDVDTGLWKSVDKSKLIVPMDVHMSRLCRILGFYERKTVGLSAAVEVTESFAEIEQADPVKYDFALSRVGITQGCTGKLRDDCDLCELFGFCLRQDNLLETKIAYVRKQRKDKGLVPLHG